MARERAFGVRVFLFNSWLAGFLGGDTKSGMVAGAALLFFRLHHLNWSWANFISKFVLSLSFHSGENSRCLSWEPWFFTHLAAVQIKQTPECIILPSLLGQAQVLFGPVGERPQSGPRFLLPAALETQRVM